MHFDPFRPGARIAWLGGAEIKLGGLEKFIYVNSRGAWGHEKFIPVWIKGTRWRPKKKIFTEILRDFLAEIRNSNSFSGRKQVISKKKRSSQKFYEIRCEFAKITKIRVANTNLSLELHSSSPDPVRFFGAQTSLGGHNFRLGGHGPGMPPVAPGLNPFILRMRRSG